MEKERRFSVSLREEEYSQLEALARETERDVRQYARQVLRWYLRCRGEYLEPWAYFRDHGGGPL